MATTINGWTVDVGRSECRTLVYVTFQAAGTIETRTAPASCVDYLRQWCRDRHMQGVPQSAIRKAIAELEYIEAETSIEPPPVAEMPQAVANVGMLLWFVVCWGLLFIGLFSTIRWLFDN